jgi:hypothetical protein
MQSFEELPAHATVPSQVRKYTIRSNFEEYRDSGGARWVQAEPPEMSTASETGEITCMARLKCPVGIPSSGLYIGPHPSHHESLRSAMETVGKWIAVAIDSGFLWCPPESVRAERCGPEQWKCSGRPLSPEVSTSLTAVERSSLVPLSISTVHAALESDAVRNQKVFEDFYVYPRTTVPSTGLFGTSHNNSFIDLSPAEADKEPDLKAREFKDEYVGYICACHTSHSYEAGRSRRVTEDVLVRMLGYKTYRVIEEISSREDEYEKAEKSWTLFCCGQVCKVTPKTIDQICIHHRLLSMGDDPGYGMYVREALKICVISASSGVLTKKCSNGVWADNCNAHIGDHLKFSVKPRIDTSGPDFHRSCLSGHYSYIPFVEYNAAVRTSISSAQITQAITMPYCPATAAISPCHVFKPIVTTAAYKRIMIKQEIEFDPASYLPGENVCVLYHNLRLNYEDAMIISKRYVQNGGFSTISTCRYLLPATDYVSPIGRMLCSRLSKWWKSGCQDHCKHTVEYVESSNRCSPFNRPTGKVVSRVVLKTGEQSVKVKSYATHQPGDKVSTGHGQKGVSAKLVDYHDMPICTTKRGETMIPDVVIAVGSIVSRQTVGQVYESGACIERLRDPSMDMVIQPDEIRGIGEDVTVMNPWTGKFYETVAIGEDDPDRGAFLKTSFATIGYVRAFNQSQVTRDKHFTSHRSMTKNTLRTPTRRSKGGALREGEMEVQATVAAGLVNCVEELRRRGDEVMVHVCKMCQRLRLLHSCTDSPEFAEVALPYDIVVLDCVNKITYNCSFVYDIEPDV